MRRPLVGLILLAACTQAGASPNLRSFESSRPLDQRRSLHAQIQYGAGHLTLAPAAAGELYRMQLSYDARHFEPVATFDGDNDHLLLGIRSRSGVSSARSEIGQNAKIAFSPQVDLALEIDVGALDGALELGGLRISQLELNAGATESEVSFSSPNHATCRQADFNAGAASLKVTRLGNSGCSRLIFSGGVGQAVLDFSGRWQRDMTATLSVAMGTITLRVPRSLGVRLAMDRVLASFEPTGLVPEGKAFVSPNYASATNHLDIQLNAALGDVDLEWLD